MDPQTQIIYLDNVATSFPKPPEVLQEMLDTYSRLGVSPGRGSYDLASQCEQHVHTARRQISDFFGGDGPDGVIFAYNSTDALNTVIRGLVEPGCRVVSSRLEHNSVLRPLHHLREQGLISFDLVHEDLGTSPRRGVRFSLGPTNTDGDIFAALEAVQAIAANLQ